MFYRLLLSAFFHQFLAGGFRGHRPACTLLRLIKLLSSGKDFSKGILTDHRLPVDTVEYGSGF